MLTSSPFYENGMESLPLPLLTPSRLRKVRCIAVKYVPAHSSQGRRAISAHSSSLARACANMAQYRSVDSLVCTAEEIVEVCCILRLRLLNNSLSLEIYIVMLVTNPGSSVSTMLRVSVSLLSAIVRKRCSRKTRMQVAFTPKVDIFGLSTA
jgi:hypothetical protein